MKINPHDPVYPIQGQDFNTYGGKYTPTVPGLPIRLELAARFMEASISNQSLIEAAEIMTPKRADIALTRAALDFADALIAAYNEGQE